MGWNLCLLLLTCMLSSCGSGESAESGKPPNILFILADDLGYGDLGTYPSGSSHGTLSTPYLDALAKEAMRFTDAYAGGAVCAPSRCSLMTGRHNGHCTVRQNGQVLNETDVTIASILKKAGYRTALLGKWGLGAGDGSTYFNIPNGKGFDYFLGYNSQEVAHNYYPEYLRVDQGKLYIEENKNASVLTCGYPYTEHCVWAEDVFVYNAVSYLKNASKGGQPFYMFLSFTTPHAGGVGFDIESGVPCPYDLPQYQNASWPRVERDFASTVSLQDMHVGVVLDALEQYGLYNNTVVFYASDNGAHNEGGHSYLFFNSSGPLRGYKRSLHEGGVRSPLLIRWPGVTKGGTTSIQQWGFWDFMSTAADLAGVPSSSLPPNDGYSLVPTLEGKSQEQPKYIYHEYCSPLEDKLGWGQSVRFDHWKAVRYNLNSVVELYNLNSDLGENHDVSLANYDIVEQAIQYMDEAHKPGPYCGYIPPNPN